MSWFAVVFAALIWLPGRLALRTPAAAKAMKRTCGGVERLFLEVAISAVLLLWMSVTLATLGFLRWWILAAAGAVVIAALWHRSRRAGAIAERRTFKAGGDFAVVALLIVAGSILYQPGFEQIVGGRDPVTYIVSGIHTGRTGAWVSYDDEVADLSLQHRAAFLSHDWMSTDGIWGSSRFLGWYLMDPDTGKVVPQGLPLYPSTLAVGYLVAGLEGVFRTTAVLAIFSAIILFFLGRHLFGPVAGFAAAAMLLVSPTQVWFARYGNAETLAQLLIGLGLLGFVLYRRTGVQVLALLSAAALGLAWQAHIWMVWLLLPLAAVLVSDLLRGRFDRQAAWFFWAPLVALAIQAGLVYLFVVEAYLHGLSRVLESSMWMLAPLPVGVLFVVLIELWRVGRSRALAVTDDARKEADESVNPLRFVAAALVVAAAVYGYWLRPLTGEPGVIWRVEAVPRLVLAIGVAGFGFAVAGIAQVLVSRASRPVALIVTGFALSLMVPVLWEPNITPTLMWSLRRYQPFLPIVFLFAAVPLWGPGGIGAGGRAVGRVVAASVSLFLIGTLALQGVAYRGFKQPGEMIALVDEIAASVEDDAVLVFEGRSGWGGLDLAPALRYWKGFDVLWLPNKATDGAALYDLVLRQAQAGKPVYFFTQGWHYYLPRPRLEPHRQWWLEKIQLEETRGRLPLRRLTSRLPMASYRLHLSGSNGPLEGRLEVGEWDDIYVGEALPPQVSGSTSARWTKQQGFFWLPGLDADAREIVVVAATVANSESAGRTLKASLDGIDLGEIPIQRLWEDYVFEIPSDWQPEAGSAPLLRLSTEALQPDQVIGNGDMRYLGVMVDTIVWE